MQNFKDENGDTWGIEINRPVLRLVKQETGILLTDLFEDEMALLLQLSRDPLLGGDVLWCLCSEQAKRREMDETAFIKATDGDCYEPAIHAVIQAIIDFFPPRQREMMTTLMEAGQTMMPELNNVILEAIPGIVETEIELLKNRLATYSNTTEYAESLESMEITIPSGN